MLRECLCVVRVDFSEDLSKTGAFVGTHKHMHLLQYRAVSMLSVFVNLKLTPEAYNQHWHSSEPSQTVFTSIAVYT